MKGVPGAGGSPPGSLTVLPKLGNWTGFVQFHRSSIRLASGFRRLAHHWVFRACVMAGAYAPQIGMQVSLAIIVEAHEAMESSL